MIIGAIRTKSVPGEIVVIVAFYINGLFC